MKGGGDSVLEDTATPVSAGVGQSAHRVLFALSSNEVKSFMASATFPEAHEAEICFAETDALSSGAWEELLDEYRPTVLVSCWSTPRLPDAYAADSLLRYVCHVTGSIRATIPRRFIERGGVVTNWGGLVSAQVAEHALLLALAAMRNLAAWQPFIRENGVGSCWHPIAGIATRSLFGSQIGLHGFGQIARMLVRLLEPFGVSISAYSEGVPRELMESLGVSPRESLVDLFSGCDILFECEALTPRTAGTVNAQVLGALCDGAVFVNVGRGAVVHEPSLIREAKSGRIRIALDVAAVDPIGGDSELLSVQDAILSPHIAAPTWDRFRQCGNHALRNLRRYLRKEPLHDVITLEVYDRAT